MATSASSSSRIELLSKDNFDTWCMQVEALLTKYDLWEYVDGTNEIPPAGIGENADAANAERNTWVRADKKAKSELIMAIQSSELHHIRGCNTSRETWLKLQSVYASKGPARKATLLKKLTLQRLEDGGDVRNHLAKFFDTVDKLESMNVKINGDLLSIMLLYSLPSSYDNFRCSMESRDDLPTAESLKIKIIEETEARRQMPGNVVTAMADGNARQERHWNRKFKCFKCGAEGHKANVCPTRKPENTRINPKHSERIMGPTKKPESARRYPKQYANSVDESYVVSHTVMNGVCCSVKTETSKAWLLDSGCTAHLCGDKERFETMSELSSVKLNLASQASAEVKGKGTVCVSVASDSDHRLIEFKDTLYVPDLRTNLISVAKITNKGHEVTFRRNDAYIQNECGDVCVIAERKGDLYYIRENSECLKAEIQSECSELLKWHKRLGHLNSKDLMKLIRDGIISAINVKDAEQLSRCEVCLKGKMTVLPFPKGRVPCKETLGIVHSDVIGPFRTESLGHAKYFVTFVDDSTRWCEVYFLRQKSGVLEAFKLYKNFVEKQTERKIKCLQSDNGGEYCSADFDKYLADEGIARRLSVPHTPQQNGVAERINRTLLDMARCLMLQSGLSASFWSEATATACHIRNRCPTSGLNGQIPYEKWTERKLNIDHLKVFGSKVLVLDKDPSKDKLAHRSVEGVFVGYPRDRKGFRVWIPSTRQIVHARDVNFLEDSQGAPHDTSNLDELFTSIEKEGECDYPQTVEVSPHRLRVDETPERQPETPEVNVSPEQRRARGRPRFLRTGFRGRPRKFQLAHSPIQASARDEEHVHVEDDSDSEDDVFAGVAEISVQDALKSEACDEWKDAIESEVLSLVKNDTWEIVTKDDCKNVVGCRFVLTNKHGPDGKIERRKARLVAKGYSQKYGVNYHQTFAPVARLETLRLLLALSVQFGFGVWQFDVVTAYLNGTLEEEVTMRVPDMLNEMLERIITKEGETSPFGARAKEMLSKLRDGGNVCKLKKALYGLKQAGRQWYLKLSEKLLSLGLKSAKSEPCLFYGEYNENTVIVLVYVDDIIVASREKEYVAYVKRRLIEDFEIKDLGLAKYCLGLEIDQGKNQIVLSQTGYTLGLLKQYGMNECNPVVTPSELNVRFDEASDDDSCKDCPYRKLIGALMYLSVATRPDIANTVSRLAQFIENPRKCHWLAAKRVLRYLAGTADFGLVYTKTDESLVAYTDADWGGCTVDRRSYTGYAFLLSGAAITWKSQKQRTVALSSTEAEYVSLAEAAKEAIYLRNTLYELGLDDWAEIIIYIDNRGAQYLANDPMFHARTKHISIKYHFVRESVRNGVFALEHVSTKNMIADVLTKPLSRSNHEKCLIGLGLGFLSDLCE